MTTQKGFGVQAHLDQAEIVLIPVPWEATASYGKGTSEAPEIIRKASSQLDFFNREYGRAYNHLIYFQKTDSKIQELNKKTSHLSKKVISTFEDGKTLDSKDNSSIERINKNCKEMISYTYAQAKQVSALGKYPAVIGGDHSVSEGILNWIGEKEKGDFGVLHIDAHFDLRKSYQGFTHSHASIMRNVIEQKYPPKALVQVGIRDFSEEEYKVMQNHKGIHTYFDDDIHKSLFLGRHWLDISKEIVSHLPDSVYISLDVDGLEWSYAPSTGTPVPGGISFNHLVFLLKEIRSQNKKVIGFDVVETALDFQKKNYSEWDANVSARLIYEICGLILN